MSDTDRTGTGTGRAWRAEDLPLLGEPAPVELANSLYGAGDDRVDFLATPSLARLWLAHAALAVPFPARPTSADTGRLRALRDAVRELVDRAVEGAALSPGAVDAVNRAARLAPRSAQLVFRSAGLDGPGAGTAGPAGTTGTAGTTRTAGAAGASGGPAVRWVSAARGVDAALGALAHETVALLGGPDRARLRRCAAPDCTMVFLQQHRRRRWCHDSCGHRMRQAAYHRRRTTPSAAPADPGVARR